MSASATLHTTPDGFRFAAPAGFRHESTTVALRVAPEAGAAEAGLKAPVRPNLIVVRRPAPRAGATLAECIAAVEEELARAIPGLRGFDAVDVRFDDGATGAIIGYSYPAPRVPDTIICQLRALRLDGDTLSALTITTTLAQLTETRRDQYLRILASARLTAAHEQEKSS